MTPGVLYAGLFGGGLFMSANGGNTWSEFDAGMPDPFVHAIVFNPLFLPTPVYAGTCNTGVYVLVPRVGSGQGTSGPAQGVVSTSLQIPRR
jgi:hypothetical protein